MNSVELARKLFRLTRHLPKESRDYYKQFLRSGFIAHQKESDPELIAILHQKALADADWILSKYSSSSSSPTNNNNDKKKKST